MDDQQWNWFLTPDSTPTNPTFDQAALHTPKTEGASTHFQDAFSPYFQQYGSSMPAVDLDYSAQQHFSLENMQMPFYSTAPPQQGQQAYQELNAVNSFAVADVGSNKMNPQVDNGYIDSFQAQTPPPTRDSSTKRRSQRTQSVVFGTPSDLASRRLQASQQAPANTINAAVPASASLRQPSFSPGGMHVADMGPVTAPAMVHEHSIMWDPSASMSMSMGFASTTPAWTPLDDPFSFQPHPQHSARLPAAQHVPSNFHHTRSESTGMRPSQSFPQPSTSVHSRSKSHAPLSTRAQPMPNMMSTSSGVNPTLLYSSPGRFMPGAANMRPSVNGVPSRPVGRNASDPRHSAAHLEASRYLEAREQLPCAITNLLPSNDPGRPSIHRSNTTGHSRLNSLQSFDEPLSRSNSTTSLPRRSSPLKRVNRMSLSSIAETPKARPKTSVVLTIDSTGRARTETRVVGDSPTKSLKDRYPNLWDSSDEDDSDSDASTQVSSQNASFTSLMGLDRQTKTARLDPPLENLEGINLPRSNSSASIRATPLKAAYATAAQLRRQGSAKKSGNQSFHNRRNTLASLNSSFENLGSMDVAPSMQATAGIPQHDAGTALRRARDGRGPLQDLPLQMDLVQADYNAPRRHVPAQTHQPAPPQAHPPRTSSLQRSSRSVNFAMDTAPMVPLRSPTKSRNLSGALSAITRCICNTSYDDAQLMLQCNACQMWLHTACLGIHSSQQIPSFYVCHFCAAAAPGPASPEAQLLQWKAAAV